MKPFSLVVDNRRLLAKLVVVVAAMFAFGYALVPAYRAICEALGINVLGTAERRDAAAANTQVDRARTVTIEFDANARGPWDFKPEVASLAVHPGELSTVVYEFTNRQPRPMVAQAISSYAPAVAGAHFTKLECFCFTEHVLQPGESKRWPVAFVVDRKLPKDVSTVTLSYTFFEVPGKGDHTVSPTTGGDLIRRKASLGRTARAVFGAFFGVRRGADLDRDQAELNPVHVVVAGIAAALLFVIALVVLVRWVVTSGVAG